MFLKSKITPRSRLEGRNLERAVTRYQADPQISCLPAKCILKYVAGTIDYGLGILLIQLQFL